MGLLAVFAPCAPGGDHQCAETYDRRGEPHDSPDDGDECQHSQDGQSGEKGEHATSRRADEATAEKPRARGV
jgi:hypothetical protein